MFDAVAYKVVDPGSPHKGSTVVYVPAKELLIATRLNRVVVDHDPRNNIGEKVGDVQISDTFAEHAEAALANMKLMGYMIKDGRDTLFGVGAMSVLRQFDLRLQ